VKTIVVASDKGSRRNRCTKPCGLGGRWPLPASAKSNARAVALTTVAGARRPRHDPQLSSSWMGTVGGQTISTAVPMARAPPQRTHRLCAAMPWPPGRRSASCSDARETGEGAQLRLCFQEGRAATHSRAARGVAYGNGKRLPCSNALDSAGNRHAMNCTDPF
jgi:hypothetical protein